jgi:predicted GNAT family N-acyltransferase
MILVRNCAGHVISLMHRLSTKFTTGGGLLRARHNEEVDFREIACGGTDYEQELDLRRAVLRRPLGLDFSPEDLKCEVHDIHLGAFEAGLILATLVLTPQGCSTVKMRQVAVAPALQGRGVGTDLVAYSERVAKDRGFSTMVLHARDTAVPFYLRLGCSLEGEQFEEVGIPHRSMSKKLTS